MAAPSSALLAAVAIAVTVAAGCSDGESTNSLSKAQFVTQANQICTKRTHEREQGFRKSTPSDETVLKQKEVEKVVLEKSLPPYEAMVAEVSKLPPPSGEEKEVEKVVALMEGAASSAKEDLAKATPDIVEANEAVEAYGLRNCIF